MAFDIIGALVHRVFMGVGALLAKDICMRWIAGGVAGWIAAMLPLVGVNIAGYADVFDTQTAIIAGAVALALSIVLGGLVSGLIAGRSSPARKGGAAAALPAGVIAALLYAVSLIAVVLIAVRSNVAPAVVSAHYLRVSGAILCLGAIQVGIALAAGMRAGRRELRAGAGAGAQPQPTGRNAPHQSVSRPRAAAPSEYGANPRHVARGFSSGDNHGDNYQERDFGGQGSRSGGYDGHQPAAPQRIGLPSRSPSGPSQRSGGRGAGRDDDWR